MAEITLLCGTCGLPVAAYDGYLVISFSAIKAAERGDVAEAIWQVTHNACDQREHFEDGYHISPERIATWAALTWWSAHLMAKNWLPVTDWDELLREAAGDVPATRIRAVGSVAA